MPQGSTHIDSFPVVAVGASAGGLAALKAFFSQVEPDSGLAFVVVVHLAPDRESFLPDLLQPHSRIPVQAVNETVPLEPNRAYIIPPGSYLAAVDTHLRLAELEPKRHERGPIDHFLRTLSSTHDGQAIAVILTGTGSDGALGIKAIKEHGGLTIVQDPQDAEYDGMPRSAIATGMVDLVLPVAQIPGHLNRITRVGSEPALREAERLGAEERRILQGIFAQVKGRTRRDFSRHKPSTILRRIQRRMQLRQVETLESYLQVLREIPDESAALANEFLINVTSVFRDPEVFAALERDVVPHLFAGKTSNDTVRAWSVGCATGEEAYSLAMLLVEVSQRENVQPKIQLFASDLHDPSLKVARDGVYTGQIETELGPQRLARFFVEESGGYRVRDEIRDRIVFAQHDLLADPPFSRLDLIVCRNLLIYLQRDAQRDVIDLFHYALNPGGVLLLGTAESLDEPELFQLDPTARGIHRKRNTPNREPRLPAFAMGGTRFDNGAERAVAAPPGGSYGALHQKMVERYALPSILVGPGEKTVHVSHHAGRYLQVPGGELTANVLTLVRPELSLELHAALHHATRNQSAIRSRAVDLAIDGRTRQVIMHVRPAEANGDEQGYLLVVFDESDPLDPSSPSPDSPASEDTKTQELQAELTLSRQRLQSLAEEYETSREEMRSANEELQSTNEELRSTMEELETSKEELQSINEELVTLNQENRHKVEELSQMSSDLQNLIVATDIPTLFLDRGLRILRFTPRLADVFNIRTTDRGRPLSDLTHRLLDTDLSAAATQILADLVPIEREILDDMGRWHLMRLRPYRAAEDRIAGVVLTLVDITAQKRALEEIDEARNHAERVINTIDEPLVILTPDLRVHSANRAFYEHFQVAADDTVGRQLYELGNRQWDIPRLRTLLEEVLPQNSIVEDFEVAHRFEQVGDLVILVNARRLDDSELVLLGFRDVTALKNVEQSLRDADRRKDEFLATLAHELRNPLAAITGALAVQRKISTKPAGRTEEILERQTAHLVRLVDDLLDISRITRGKVELRREPTDLNALVLATVESLPPAEKTCVVKPSVTAETISALVDPVRIGQAITNLITNACRYSKSSDQVEVTLNRTADEALISVRDYGAGIQAEMLPRVFDMFVQLDGAPHHQRTMGIGLTLVRSLIELHGGRVEARSEGLGKGSEFLVSLPLSMDIVVAKPPSREEAESRGFDNLPAVKALVVDDNQDAADMMADLLRSLGHEVRVAYGGAAALDTLAGFNPDIALVDLGMPGIDGFEFARRVRGNPAFDRTRLVAVTGWSQQDARHRSSVAGFDHHVVKPLTTGAVNDLIRASSQPSKNGVNTR